MGQYDRLSALDASFLHMEQLEYPMHVGALTVFEGDSLVDANGCFRIAEIRDLVLSRLPTMPRFRRRLMSVPYDQGRPIWVDDEHFDITYHVRLTALPRPGTREQLVTLATRVQENPLDRSRPLWELWFVEGLEGGHVGMIQRTHHALIDGVSGVDVATLLLDIGPEYAPAVPAPWAPEPAPNPTQLLIDSVRERLTEPAEVLRSVRAGLRGPRLAVERAGRLGRSLGSLVTRDAVAPRTSLNTNHTGRHRRLGVARVPLDDVKSIRRALGGTVNDVVLTGVGGGLHRLLTSRGEDVENLRLRVLCPVSVRDETERGALGNKVSAMFVSLPVGPMDPVERLEEVRATTRHLKDKQQAVGAEFLLGLTGYMAPTLMNLAGRVVHRQPFCNVVVTNVPGPQFPLYLMGARMLEAIPIVPLTRNLTLSVGILSYDGTLYFGLFADRDSFGDIDELAAALADSFAELLKRAEESGD